MTTGKNKEQFEKWYLEKYHKCGKTDNWASYWLLRFYEVPFEMQLGVYLSYYDNLGYRIGIDCYYDMQGTYRVDFICNNNKIHGFQSKYMHTAYKEAFKKVDELINQQN